MKSKPFDAVAMTRKIRDRLGRRYYGHPDVLLKDLEEIKIKYGLRDYRSAPVSKNVMAPLRQLRKPGIQQHPEKQKRRKPLPASALR